MIQALPSEAVPQDPEGHLWDVIVLGTGAGGSTAGFNLARLGRSVLFVERGKLVHHDPSVVEEARNFTGRTIPKRRLTTGGGRDQSMKKRAAQRFRRGLPSVPAQADRPHSSVR